jgi:hypothetical protein
VTKLADYNFKVPNKYAKERERVEFLDTQTKQLKNLSNNEVLASALCVITYVNGLETEQLSGILEKLWEYLKDLKEKLDLIAAKWGVESYSLGVGFTGVQLSLTFKPKT